MNKFKKTVLSTSANTVVKSKRSCPFERSRELPPFFFLVGGERDRAMDHVLLSWFRLACHNCIIEQILNLNRLLRTKQLVTNYPSDKLNSLYTYPILTQYYFNGILTKYYFFFFFQWPDKMFKLTYLKYGSTLGKKNSNNAPGMGCGAKWYFRVCKLYG